MTTPTHHEVLKYARRIQDERPSISKGDLDSLLRARCLHGKDVFTLSRVARVGAINNPVDWLRGLGLSLQGATMLFREKPDVVGVAKVIEGVLQILSE